MWFKSYSGIIFFFVLTFIIGYLVDSLFPEILDAVIIPIMILSAISAALLSKKVRSGAFQTSLVINKSIHYLILMYGCGSFMLPLCLVVFLIDDRSFFGQIGDLLILYSAGVIIISLLLVIAVRLDGRSIKEQFLHCLYLRD